MTVPVVCVPMKLDAFVLNPSLCAPPPRSTIAPITQPNYTFLRLDSDLIQSDVLSPVDLHSAADPNTNSRITDLGIGKTRKNRIGVYLHWIMPRLYRTGTATTGYGVDPAKETDRRAQSGFPAQQGDNPDGQSPDFRSTPDRWLVVRRLHLGTVLPQSAVSNNLVPEFQAFVIESDRLMNIQDLGKDVDLEVDLSPFIKGSEDSLDVQAELFIGLKTDAAVWKELGNKAPRVPVGILNSSNQLFADYVPHNGNVFSMLDKFAYTLPDGTVATLTAATASYHVIGWHSDANVTNDPFNIINNPDVTVTHQTRLDGCKLALVQTPQASTEIQAWLQSSDSTRVLCHGTMYSVEFSSSCQPTVILADKTAALFAKASPVAVGTTPLDAILTFVKAHLTDPPASSDPVEQKLLHDLAAIEKLLLKQEEDADSQAEAADMLSAHNFAPAQDSGSHWHLSGANSDGSPTQPTPAQLATLSQLNALQLSVDEASRELRQDQWNLWSLWWTYVSAVRPSTPDPAKVAAVGALSAQIKKLQTQITAWQSSITPLAKTLPCEKGARDRFYSLRDPTLLISGVASPWPSDFLDSLQVRLDFQLVGPQSVPNNFGPGWKSFSSFVDSPGAPKPGVITVLPTHDMQQAAKGLLYEFFQLHPPDSATDTYKPTIPAGAVLPVYHDADSTKTRDLWNHTQPWFPLFLEWEAEYFHIPFEKWAFEQITEQDVIGATQTRMRYGIIPGSQLTNNDKRTIYGRVLILPQPTFSLKASIKTLLSNTSLAVLKAAIPDDKERNSLPDAIGQLEFLSSPLSGFTDHLTTRIRGTHIKPTRRRPGQGLEALAAAKRTEVGFDVTQILQMDVQTNTTPYGQEIAFAKDTKFSPFKPVTHGQFHFTKMNVIDKFGQAVSAINPAPAHVPPPLYPVISEYYQPQLLSTGAPNTVTADPPGFCQYAQLPPNINQDARLNAVFLTRDPPTATVPSPPWRPATEWESPIWGWVVVNYIEEGLQFFLPDGSFYREVRLGGVTGAAEGVAWKPFDAPATATTGTAQLDSLLVKLADPTYLQNFISTLNAAMDAVPEAPDAYAEFLSAITGKPVALVYTGWSLELATAPLTNQSTLASAPPEKALLDYTFHLKIGDFDRVYDGLVGFFDGVGNPSLTTGPPVGQELDLTTMYTYFPQGQGASTKNVTVDKYLPLTPYKFEGVVDTDPVALQLKHNAQFKVVGAVVDPFTPLHGYSGSVVPIAPLSLPPWSVQAALKVMTAFFTMGPLVITSPDMQNRYDPALRLTKDLDYSVRVSDALVGNVPPGKGVPIPALKAADWMWLQPYMVKDDKGKDDTEWNPMGIEVLDNRPKFENAPYTAVEGYLQLRKALDGASVAAKD